MGLIRWRRRLRSVAQPCARISQRLTRVTTKSATAISKIAVRTPISTLPPDHFGTTGARPLACHARTDSSAARPSSPHTGQACSDSIHVGLLNTGMRRATDEVASCTPHTRHRTRSGSTNPAVRPTAARTNSTIIAHRGGLPVLLTRPTANTRKATTRVASHGFLVFQRCPLLSSQELRRSSTRPLQGPLGRPETRPGCGAPRPIGPPTVAPAASYDC